MKKTQYGFLAIFSLLALISLYFITFHKGTLIPSYAVAPQKNNAQENIDEASNQKITSKANPIESSYQKWEDPQNLFGLSYPKNGWLLNSTINSNSINEIIITDSSGANYSARFTMDTIPKTYFDGSGYTAESYFNFIKTSQASDFKICKYFDFRNSLNHYLSDVELKIINPDTYPEIANCWYVLTDNYIFKGTGHVDGSSISILNRENVYKTQAIIDSIHFNF